MDKFNFALGIVTMIEELKVGNESSYFRVAIMFIRPVDIP